MSRIKFIFAGILSVCSLYLSAQTSQLDYRPFAQDGKTWKTQVGGIKENLYCNSIDGDTVINGEEWKKVYNYIALPQLNYSYYAAIRDAGKKVYAIAKGSSKPRLLYDFGLGVGDIVPCGVEGHAFLCLLDQGEQPDSLLGFPFETYLKLERIDTIEARGQKHRRFTLTLLDAYQEPFLNGDEDELLLGSVVWVEGFGSGAGPFAPWMSLPARRMLNLGCEVDRNCIFSYSDFYDADMAVTVSNAPLFPCGVSTPFDLIGRRLAAPPAKGVYIEGGKLHVNMLTH